jgi:invasion protein IalB
MRLVKRVITLLMPLLCGVESFAATISPFPGDPGADTFAPSNLKTSTTPGWLSKCVSESRKGTLVCSIEETIVLTSSGQALASVVVKTQPDVNKVIMFLRVPVGLYLPAGLELQVDDNKPQQIPLQTCDLQGCFAETEISSGFLAALKSGKLLSISCQNSEKRKIVLPLALDGFVEAFQKIQ